MKKPLFLVLVFFITASTAFSQFNSNSKMVGASSSLDFGFLSEKDDVSGEKTSIREFDLNPRAAYFLKNRIALGGDFNYASSRSKIDGSDPASDINWRIGPFARYYYKTVSWFVPFGEVKAGYGNDITKYSFGGEEFKTKHNVWYVGLGVGAALFLADNFSLEAMLRYQYEKAKNPEGGGSHSTHGFMLGFGFSFYFNSLLQDTDGPR